MKVINFKKNKPKRMIAAALVTAVSIIGGALLQSISNESTALIWLSTAVYMLGPLLATLIVWPLVGYDGWLFTTAVLLSLAIVLPWAIVNPSAWVTTYLPQLGQWANVLFIVLLTSQTSAGRPPKFISWALTCFYLMIMLGMPFLL